MTLDYQKFKAPLISTYKQENRRLNSDLSFVKDLFNQLLDMIPIMFIVIDGLDEIPQVERLQLLRTILEILQAKSNVKVLISSRPEDDISKLISKETRPLRVHDCNTRDIEAYVNSRASSLVTDASLSGTGLAQEISHLMKAIAAKSQGMFLYARLVCDSIGLLGDIDSIKEAVDNLPDGLQEAYYRILSRITEGLHVRQREETRQILALLTCCAVPLSKNEIQLAVYTAQGRDPSKGCKGLFLNILDRCGPIVEEVDGHFHFVHFTAREYLLSRQSEQYLTESAANACVASMCIKYLNSACFDVDINDDTLSLYIQSGALVLLAYVCNHWLHHVANMGRQDFRRLKDDIEYLIDKRVNPSFVGEAAVSESQDAGCSQSLSLDEENINRVLGSARVFSEKRKRDLSFDDDEDWNCLDPFTFTKTEARSRHLLESMLCETVKHRPGCTCQELKNIYGNSIYKCGRPGCPSYRAGFDTNSKRMGHIQRHTRPFKCQYSECSFAHLGFAKKTDLESHLAQAHEQNLFITSENTLGRTNESNEEELKSILIDAVQENDMSIIRAEANAVRKFILDLLLSAYQGRASDAVIKHLISEYQPNLVQIQGKDRDMEIYTNIFRAAVEHGNYDVFRMPCTLFNEWNSPSTQEFQGRSRWVGPTLKLIGRTRRAELLETVASSLREMAPSFREFWKFTTLFSAVIPREPDTQAEILALECFERLKPHLSQYSNHILTSLGASCCSIAIAEVLLASGADINGGSWRTNGPLVSAARQTSPGAARFMEFLVRNGSRTSIRVQNKDLSELPGPRSIQKWIGITWEELVKQNIPSVHASKKPPPIDRL